MHITDPQASLFQVRMRIGDTWYEDNIEAPTNADAAIVLDDRLRAQFGDPAGIEEMHVHRIYEVYDA